MAQIERSVESDTDMGTAFVATSPIRLDQFDDEISAAFGWGLAGAGLSAEGSSMEATESTPVMIRIGHDGASTDRVLAIGAAHEPNDEYFPSVTLTPTFEEVADKASKHGYLSEDEIQVALRGLLAARPSTGV